MTTSHQSELLNEVPLTAAILAGGLGTRLKDVLRDCPKTLARVHQRPFLFYLLDQVAGLGVERIVLCTGHLGEQVRSAVGDSYRSIPVLYSRECIPLGTGGALRDAFRTYPSPLWLVMNGDSYLAFDSVAFVKAHVRGGYAGSLTLVWVDDAARFGTVRCGEDGRIRAFEEKNGEHSPGWVNSGVYLLGRELLETMPGNSPLSLEREVFPAWLERGLGGHSVHAPFLDIGTPDSILQAEQFFDSALGEKS